MSCPHSVAAPLCWGVSKARQQSAAATVNIKPLYSGRNIPPYPGS